MTHKLLEVRSEVEKTHPRLGNLVAFTLIAVKAKKCLMIVAPAGTGKSVASTAVAKALGNEWILDSLTRSSLKYLKDKLNGFRDLAVVDDMGKIDTPYARVATMTTFAELCYSHFVSKYTVDMVLEISDFFGSAILNIQSPILASVMTTPEWEANIQDKTLRYYHLYRPERPIRGLPVVNLPKDSDFEKVDLGPKGGRKWHQLLSIGEGQWSDARCLEHISDLLRSVASWDNRLSVEAVDYRVLLDIMAPCGLERQVVQRISFDAPRDFNLNLFAMLVELASWKKLTIDRICRDYKVTAATVWRVIALLEDYFETEVAHPNKLKTTERTRAILRQAGVRRNWNATRNTHSS